MPWAAAEAKPSNSIVCSLVSPDSAVLGKPRGGSSRRNTKAAVGYITAKMLHTEPKRPMSRFFMSGAPVWRVPIRVVVNALSPTRCKGQIFGRSGSLPLLRLCHKSISHSTHREQMARLCRIVFDIAPQADDEIIYGAGVGVFVQAPDFFQNRFAGHDAAVVADEMAEKLGFHKGEVDGVAVDSQLKFAEVDGASVEGKHIVSLRRGRWLGGGWTRGLRLPHPVAAAQQSLQTGEKNGKFKRFGK